MKLQRSILILFATLIGSAALYLPAWYWTDVQFWFWSWTPLASGAIGAVIGALLGASIVFRRQSLHFLAFRILAVWLFFYVVVLAQILPHCATEKGNFYCVVAGF